MTAREWHITWRSIIVPLLAPETRTWTAATTRRRSMNNRRQVAKIMNGERVKPSRRRDEKWQPFDQRKTAWEVD